MRRRNGQRFNQELVANEDVGNYSCLLQRYCCSPAQAHAQSDDEATRRAEASAQGGILRATAEAEERMEQAAREIAEITRERLPNMAQIERRIEFSNKPRIGITIEATNDPARSTALSSVASRRRVRLMMPGCAPEISLPPSTVSP